MNYKIKFSIFVLISALGLAGVAAYFSIIGISSLFSGAVISVGIMAFFLEIGKLCSVSFVYRYWNKITKLYKLYFTLAVIVLTIITSGGIGGFLLSAYQKSSLTYKLNQEKIVSTESSKGYYSNLVVTAGERIRVLNETRKVQEDRLSSALKDPILTRNAIQLKQIQDQTIKMIDQANEDIKTENNKIEEARTKMQGIDEKVNEMKISGIEKKDIQTFKFLADALGVSLDTVAKWFIVSLIFVFDPLAIALILAYNVVVYRKEDERVYDEPKVESAYAKKPEKLEMVDFPEDKKKTQIVVPPVEIKKTIEEIPVVVETTTTSTTTLPPVVVEVPKIEQVVNVPVETTSNMVTNPPVESTGDEFFRGMFKK
jgi:hypothetical protein